MAKKVFMLSNKDVQYYYVREGKNGIGINS